MHIFHHSFGGILESETFYMLSGNSFKAVPRYFYTVVLCVRGLYIWLLLHSMWMEHAVCRLLEPLGAEIHKVSTGPGPLASYCGTLASA